MMLRTTLLHPEILQALASAGHGSKVLVADSNYPCSTTCGAHAKVVYLNLAPGVVSAIDVLRTLSETVPIESASVMSPENGPEPPIYSEFRSVLRGMDLRLKGRHAFYESVQSAECCLVIATGETRLYSCILLTIGVVEPR